MSIYIQKIKKTEDIYTQSKSEQNTDIEIIENNNSFSPKLGNPAMKLSEGKLKRLFM